MDALARAYAILGLNAAATAAEVRSRYRELVRRWHPDRFAQDPRGQAEAAERMREINDAFRLLAQASSMAPAERSANDHRTPGARLSREEVERMIQGIGTQGPVDWILNVFRIGWRRSVGTTGLHFQIAWGVALVADVARQRTGIGKERDPSRWWTALAFVAALAALKMILPKTSDS